MSAERADHGADGQGGGGGERGAFADALMQDGGDGDPHWHAVEDDADAKGRDALRPVTNQRHAIDDSMGEGRCGHGDTERGSAGATGITAFMEPPAEGAESDDEECPGTERAHEVGKHVEYDERADRCDHESVDGGPQGAARAATDNRAEGEREQGEEDKDDGVHSNHREPKNDAAERRRPIRQAAIRRGCVASDHVTNIERVYGAQLAEYPCFSLPTRERDDAAARASAQAVGVVHGMTDVGRAERIDERRAR